jgi:hypothetical protein
MTAFHIEELPVVAVVFVEEQETDRLEGRWINEAWKERRTCRL